MGGSEGAPFSPTEEDPVKRTRALLAAALPMTLLAATLAGCSAGGGGGSIATDASGVACVSSGSASDAIKVDGEFGESLTLASDTPVSAGEVQRSVLIEGDGVVFAEGQSTTASYTIFNGKTGEVINSMADAELPNNVDSLTGASWAYEAVRCASVGERTAIVMSVDEALEGGDPAESGVEDLSSDDAFVFVFDFTGAAAVCDALTPREENYPEVDLGDGSSEPTITIPECMEPPTELEIEVLVEGDGAVVAADQSIMTNYVGVKWNGAERFDGSWDETGIEFSTAEGALIDGFTRAMIGQKIGSTILVTMPPEMAYGEAGAGHPLSGHTLTFVLQLVSVAPAA